MFGRTATQAVLATCMFTAISNAAPQFGSAAPAFNSGLKKTSYNATLDKITVTNPLAPTGSLGTYKGLRYNELGIAEQVAQGEGLIPQSKPNVATFALEGELLNEIPFISPNYEGSTGQYFDLEQLYFGCTITTVTNAVNVPASCTMTFTAYDSDNNQIAEKSADYERGAQMQQANFGPAFYGFYKIEFTDSGLMDNLLQVGIVDSLKYDVYNSS